MTLYDKLKPEIKDKLEANYAEYKVSIDYIFNKLQTKDRYSELTIDDVRTLNTFSNSELYSKFLRHQWLVHCIYLWFVIN